MKAAITAAVVAGVVGTTLAGVGAYVVILAVLDRADMWWRYNAPLAAAFVALAAALVMCAGWMFTGRNHRRTRQVLRDRMLTLRQVIEQRNHYQAVAEQVATRPGGCPRCRDREVLRRNMQRLTDDEQAELDRRFNLIIRDVASELAAERERGDRP